MDNLLTEEQIAELDEKLANYESYVNNQIEIYSENDKTNIDNGEYDYLVKETNLHSDIELSEELQEELDKSSLTLDQFIDYCVENDLFESSYEELSSPFQYGGQIENEICTISWGGDKECSISQKDIVQFQPSFSLNLFNSLSEFKQFVSYHVGSLDYVDSFWSFFKEGKEQQTIIYNTDYDIVRVTLKDEETLINYLKNNAKPVIKKDPKHIELTIQQYKEYRLHNCGFCIECSHISDGSHEPDAQEYDCENCSNPTSYGMDHSLAAGYISIKEE